jgi:hypothetical protein
MTLAYRGIDYDTGTRYVRDRHSRPDWSPAVLRAHISAIRHGLGCNAVTVFGSEVRHLRDAAEAAVGAGLHVWVQPRLPDAGWARTAEHLGAVADAVEPLRAAGGPVRLNVGCELSIFAPGMLPGPGYEWRIRALRVGWPVLLPVANLRLGRLLARLAAVGRHRFGGELTYGSGSWESVNWRRFDAVGLNHYRDRANRRTYERTLAAAVRRHGAGGRPVLVTEFGCATWAGAADRGADGDAVVDWGARGGPRVRGQLRRDEAGQAHCLGELIDVFERVGVAGAFVFEYSEPEYPRSDDPRHDLDLGSFGIVAVRRDGDRLTDEPKAAYRAIAERFGGVRSA